ncbi:AMP-dependent synthetase and ligase [Kribbella flavida DSM 17836]|uniref:AMP-dependent synthetase and ligase n=1 Tax=Kribbella flavida (strain DSM 17836 / JCM 10339 / NBRC 14399) TaxID=479435 RepID=D2PT19_KRIFD|nr:class I adenylate-forming enzyme family protein [Kribbella flavida]ADB35071.1 AMP-dependent synthetase and ligase [Kribbella flavida DSM 17836]
MRSLRAQLAADPSVGTGNVLATVIAHGADLDGPGLTFDTAVDQFAAEHPLTLGELDERVQARTAWLHARGIGRRNVVAIWATDAADIVLSFLALTRVGAIPALLNGKMAPAIASEYIRRLRVDAILADAAHRELLAGQSDQPDSLHGAPILGEPKELGTGNPGRAPEHYRHHRDDPVVITHTSGTTGVPKAVLHTHTTLYAALKHLLTMPQAQGTDRILNALPIPHTATILMVNQVLGNRAEMLLLSSQDASDVLAAIERWKPHGVYGFAVTWAGLARADLSRYAVESVRLWFNTGDCAHEPHIRKLVAAGSRETVTRDGRVTVPGSHFIDGLGSSEMGHNGFHITHTPDTEHYGRCIGKPYQFAEAAVLDADGNELPPGRPGLLGFRSPSVSPGYWNDSVNTFRFRLNGWFLTGDLVHRDESGHYFHLDRVPDAVAGFEGPQLYTSLSEERILAALPEVLDCTVIVVPDNGSYLTDVLLELAPDADPALDRTDRIHQAVGAEVAATIRRIAVIGQDDVPVTVTGKVRKVALRQDRLAGVSS